MAIDYQQYPNTYTLLNILFQEIVGAPIFGSRISPEFQKLIKSIPYQNLINFQDREFTSTGSLNPDPFLYENPDYSETKITMCLQARRSFFFSILNTLNRKSLSKLEKILTKGFEKFKPKTQQETSITSITKPDKDHNLRKYLREFADPFIKEGRSLSASIEDKINNRQMLSILCRSLPYSIIPPSGIEIPRVERKCDVTILFLVIILLATIIILATTVTDTTGLIFSESVTSAFTLFFLGLLAYSFYTRTKNFIGLEAFTERYSKILKATLGENFGLEDKPLKLIFSESQQIFDSFNLLTSQHQALTPDIASVILKYCYQNVTLERFSLFQEIFIKLEQDNNNKPKELTDNIGTDKEETKFNDDILLDEMDEDNDSSNVLSSLVIKTKLSKNEINITLSSEDSSNEKDPVVTPILRTSWKDNTE